MKDLSDTTAERVFGVVDAAKLKSSLTLFAAAAPDEPLFKTALTDGFGGAADGLTLTMLAQKG